MTKQRTSPSPTPGPKKTPGKPAQAPAITHDPYGFEAPEVDSTLYDEESRVSYPNVTYMARYANEDDISRPFIVEQDRLSAMPLPFWTPEEIKFGDSPNEPYTSVYLAQSVRFVPLGVRKRQVIETRDGTKYYYHIYTRAVDRVDESGQQVEGRMSFHYQVLGQLPGLPTGELIQVGLRGLTRTVSWSHDGKRYDKFPVGVEDRLLKYTTDATKAVGSEMPMWCAWWIDLRGAYADGKPYFIPVGPGGETWVQPFTCDLRTSQETRPETGVYTPDGMLAMDSTGLPWTRYVGAELFAELQELRRDVVNPWIAQWKTASVQEAPDDFEPEGEEPIGVEEDPIPF